MLIGLTILYILPYISWEMEWGKIIMSLVRTDASVQFQTMELSPYVAENYSAIEALQKTALLSVLFFWGIGMLVFAFNYAFQKGQYCLTGEERVYEMSNDNLHGEVVDDNTFVGQMKLDLEHVITQDGVLELNLSTIGFDDVTMPTAPGIAHRFEGEWCYEIPFEVDVEQSKIITVNQQETGFVLEKVLVTPYQFITFFERPYENAELYFEVFNQDGEILPWGEEKDEQMIFELDNMELSEVHIYVFDKYDDWAAMHQGKREDNPIAKNAIFNAEVQIK